MRAATPQAPVDRPAGRPPAAAPRAPAAPGAPAPGSPTGITGLLGGSAGSLQPSGTTGTGGLGAATGCGQSGAGTLPVTDSFSLGFRHGTLYLADLAFHVPQEGRYTISVVAVGGGTVVLAPALTSWLHGVSHWATGAALGFLLVAAGMVLLVVGLVGRRRPDPAGPGFPTYR